MALTPEDVVNKRFQATKFREGYDQDEVDDFLDEVVSELRRLYDENEDLRGKLGACERRVGELSRASVARDAMPEPERPQTVGSVVMPNQPMAPQPAMRQAQPQMSMGLADPRAQLEAAGQQSQGPEAAAGMLALAQKLHDEYVRNGEQKRDQIVGEAEEHAQRLVKDAEEKQRQTLGSLEQERSLLERKIDELRAFEREYRSRLKSYLEGQLRDLEAKAAVVPNRGSQPPASPISTGGGGSYSSNGSGSRAAASYVTDSAATSSPTYTFGGTQN